MEEEIQENNLLNESNKAEDVKRSIEHIWKSKGFHYVPQGKYTPAKGEMEGIHYGNWCGPGNNGQFPNDCLDSVCRIHDYYYQINRTEANNALGI